MVILGGLEIVAAGFLLSEFNKDKVEAREHKKHRRDSNGRPHSRPHRQHDTHASTHLLPPSQPPRPLSAPPAEFRPTDWQHGQVYPVQQQQPQQIQPQQQFPPKQWQQQPNWTAHPPPQNALQHFQSRPPMNTASTQPLPPGPGALQRPNTFQPYQQQYVPPGPFLQSSQTMPSQPPQQFRPTMPAAKPSASPPNQNVYVDSKTGKISHNLYPPDHPMARGLSHDGGGITRERYDNEKYARPMGGGINTGLVWSDRDEDDLAYGRDYSKSRRSREDSYDRVRGRRRSSPPPRY